FLFYFIVQRSDHRYGDQYSNCRYCRLSFAKKRMETWISPSLRLLVYFITDCCHSRFIIFLKVGELILNKKDLFIRFVLGGTAVMLSYIVTIVSPWEILAGI